MQGSAQDTCIAFLFHYPRCSLRYREAFPRAKKTAREMRYSRKRGKSQKRGAKGTRLRIYERKSGWNERGMKGRSRTHRIRILCKRITSDYARLSANRITSLLFARRQAVDLVNSNSTLPRAESPMEQRFSERLFFLNHSDLSSTRLNVGQRRIITCDINFLNFFFKQL